MQRDTFTSEVISLLRSKGDSNEEVAGGTRESTNDDDGFRMFF